MKYILALLLFMPSMVCADMQKFFACDQFTGVVQIREHLIDVNNMSEEEAYVVYTEVEAIKEGESKGYNINLNDLVNLRCA